MDVQRQRNHEVAAAIQTRYLQANKAEKGHLLDELVAATG